MSAPTPPSGRPTESIRATARRRFLLAGICFAAGFAILAAAHGFLVGRSPLGALTGLLFGVLLQVLGLGMAVFGSVLGSRAFPLSEYAAASRRILLLALAVVLPIAAIAGAAWLGAVGGSVGLVLLPSFPPFWGPLASFSALGLQFAAREFASERMAALAALGCGGVIAMALASGWASVSDPIGTLGSPRLAGELFLVALGFAAIAFAFERDAWAIRARRGP